jgi:multiple sugar transport system substrate-binding protein
MEENKMKKRRNGISVLSLMIALLMVLTSFSGCGNSTKTASSTGAKRITVILPQNEMDTVGFMQQQTGNFEKETGIQVELINMSWDNVAAKLSVEMSSGGSSYDVIEFDNSWVSKYTTNKWVVPLDSYMTQDMKTGIIPGLQKIFSVDSKTYGIPWNNDTRFFMYNKNKLDAAGITDPPSTWDQLVQDSKILKSKGLVKYGFIDAYAQSQSLTNEITYIVYSNGGDFLKDGKPDVTANNAVTEAYDFLQKGLNIDKIIDPASLTSDQENAANVFCQGDTAFFPQAWAGVYEEANTAGTSKIVGQVAVAPYSIGKSSNTNVVLSMPEAMAIPTKSKNKEAAWKYIQYMSSMSFDKNKAMTIGALPIYTKTFSDADVIKKYPYWVNFGKQSENAKGLQQILWYDQFSNVVQVMSQKILLNQISTSDGLKQIQDQMIHISQ